MLKKIVVLTLVVVVSSLGCSKKQEAMEGSQEPLSMEELTVTGTEMTPQAATPVTTAPAAKLAPLPPAGPYQPTGIEIQTALKNTGFYTGEIDGKIGPLTRNAVGEFQKANNLKADWKVGPKTWAVLSAYLAPLTKAKTKKR